MSFKPDKSRSLVLKEDQSSHFEMETNWNSDKTCEKNLVNLNHCERSRVYTKVNSKSRCADVES